MARNVLGPVLAGAIAAAALTGCPSTGPLQNPTDIEILVRPDNIKVYCQRIPPDIINKSVKTTVDASVYKIGQVVKGSLTSEIDPQKFLETSVSVTDYRVIARQVCVQYANGVYTPQEYKAILEKILPVISKQAETNARVDAEFDKMDVVSYGDRNRLSVHIRVRPVSKDNHEAAHVIYGIAVVHDEDRLPAGHQAKRSALSCKEVPTCIGWRLWDNADNPIIVRGGDDPGARLTFTVDAPGKTKAVRIFWEIYQREAAGGHQCVADQARKGPEGGIPYLKVVDASGRTVAGAACYVAYGDQLVVVERPRAAAPVILPAAAVSMSASLPPSAAAAEKSARRVLIDRPEMVGTGNGGVGTGSGGPADRQ